jgi:TRAP-type C4-dicarboxylate transport system permease small subunit
MLRGFCSFTEVINRLVGWLVIGILAVLVAIVSTAVFCRYVLSDSLTWSSEVARYLCIWVSFLAASIALRRRMHIGVSFFTERLNRKSRRFIRIAVETAIVIFLVVTAYLGFQLSFMQMNQTSPALMLPMGIPYLAIPVSAVLMALQSIALLFLELIGVNEDAEGIEVC